MNRKKEKIKIKLPVAATKRKKKNIKGEMKKGTFRRSGWNSR